MNDFLSARIEAMRAEVDQIEADRLLNTSIEVLCEPLVQKYRIDVPVLVEDSIDPSQFRPDRSALANETAIEVDVTFKGDAAIFRIGPFPGIPNLPNVMVLGNRLRIRIEGADLKGGDVKLRVDADIDNINRYLDWWHRNEKAFNSCIYSQATEHIRRRQRKPRQDRDRGR